MVKPLPCHKGFNRRFCAGPEHCRRGCPKHPITESSIIPELIGASSPAVGAASSSKPGYPPRECFAGYEDGCPGGCVLERILRPDPPLFSGSSVPSMARPLPCHKGFNRRFCAGPKHCLRGCPKHPIIESSTIPEFIGASPWVVGAASSLKPGYPPRERPGGYEDGCLGGRLLERIVRSDPPRLSGSSAPPKARPLPCHKGFNRRFCAGPEHCRRGCPEHPIIESSAPPMAEPPHCHKGLSRRFCAGPKHCLRGCPKHPFTESSTIPEMIGGAIIGSVWGLLIAGVVAAGVAVGIGVLALLFRAFAY